MNNTNWLYVPSFPLHISVALMDPTSVDHPKGADPNCSSISQCTCTNEIVSAKCDLSLKRESSETKGIMQWMMDSGASMAFTSDPQDYSELIYLCKDKQIPVSTANGVATIISFGTVFICTELSGTPNIVRINPVFLLPGLKEQLLSMGQLLHSNLCIYSDRNTLTFSNVESTETMLTARNSIVIHQNIYWVDTQIVTGSDLTAFITIHNDAYTTWHQHLGHQVLSKFKLKTKNFPQSFTVPKKSPIPCEGCTEGKMTNRPFLENPLRSARPFQRIHSDIHQYPIESYSKYKYYSSFLDDCTSSAWVTLLRKKTEAYKATIEFLEMILMQSGVIIMGWFSDDGGEYISVRFMALMKSKGIVVFRSVPEQKQMNRHPEGFNCTISNKAEAMRFRACLPQSWWEFCVLHVVYLYNCTPARHLQWETPYEQIDKEKPDLSKLKVFGCGAYIFIHRDLRKNKLSPKSELMIFLGYRFSHESNMRFMRSPNNVLFHSTTALFYETMFPKCGKSKVPPVTKIHDKTKKSGDEPTVVHLDLGDDSSDDDDDYHPIQPYTQNELEDSQPGPPKPPLPPTVPMQDIPSTRLPRGSPRGRIPGRGTSQTSFGQGASQGPPPSQARPSNTRGGATSEEGP